MTINQYLYLFWGTCSLSSIIYAQQISPDKLPLLTIHDMEYEGAFRISDRTFGTSSMSWAEGPLCYNPENHSLFITGHTHHKLVAEFPIPELSKAQEIADLNMTNTVIQNFAATTTRTELFNDEGISSIGGMYLFDGPNGKELLINAYKYYDAAAKNTLTTMIMRNANDLENSEVEGFFRLQGRAHAARWISPIPQEWETLSGGAYIAGSSSGDPIIGRWPVGPSAFVFDPMQIVGVSPVPDSIPTITLLDYSLNRSIGKVKDLGNANGTNDLWTHMTRAVYGFIIPGTRTYFTIGSQAGTGSGGICYKVCTPDNGTSSGGYHSRDPEDYHIGYWLFDMNDLIKAKNGEMEPSDIMPYEYGTMDPPLNIDGRPNINGGTYDPASGLLYLSFGKADRQQGTYSNTPIIGAYSFNIPATASELKSIQNKEVSAISIFKNSAYPFIQITVNLKDSEELRNIHIIDINGKLVKELPLQKFLYWDGTNNDGEKIASGSYFLSVKTSYNRHIQKLVLNF
jgi:hypothetical protein